MCAGSRDSYTAFHRSILYAINEVLHSLIQNNKATKVRIGALLLFGDKWRLFIPPDMAYGEASPTPAIPPNSALVFEVELLEVR